MRYSAKAGGMPGCKPSRAQGWLLWWLACVGYTGVTWSGKAGMMEFRRLVLVSRFPESLIPSYD